MNGKTVPPATPEELRTVVDDLARLIAEQPHEHVYERGMVWESSHCLDCGEQKPPQQGEAMSDTTISDEGCRQCEKLELALEREHRRYLDARRLADDRRKEMNALKTAMSDGVSKEVSVAIAALEEAVHCLAAANERGIRSIGTLIQQRSQARDLLIETIQRALSSSDTSK